MITRHRQLVGALVVAFAAASWGTWPVIVHAVGKVGYVSAAVFSAVLMAVMTLASLPVALVDRKRVRASVGEWALVAWLGVSDALNVFCFFGAYRHTSVAVAVLTHYLTPLFVALAAPIFLRDRFRAEIGACVVVALAGLTLLLRPWGEGLSASDIRGASLGAASAAFYASNVIVNKRMARAFSAGELMFFHGLVATPLLGWMVPTTEWASVNMAALKWVALAALGPGAASGILFVWGLQRIPASVASSLTYLEPLVAVALGAVVLGQTLGWTSALGALLVLGSTYIALRGAEKLPETQ